MIIYVLKLGLFSVVLVSSKLLAQSLFVHFDEDY